VARVGTVAVIGAGALGRGIAQVMALAGYHTILEDLIPGALREASNEIRAHLAKAVETGEVSSGAASAALGLLQYAGSIEETARQADVVIESVPDELESKVEIFTLLDKICRPHTILICTSAELSITEIARVTYRRERCVGMRFAKPVRETQCLRVVQTGDTDEDTMAAAVEMARHMTMRMTVVKERAL
jgi:3-hydroxybutyryl-CoA dehydrogenase